MTVEGKLDGSEDLFKCSPAQQGKSTYISTTIARIMLKLPLKNQTTSNIQHCAGVSSLKIVLFLLSELSVTYQGTR